MPPSVELSSATFSRLQNHAVPLVDTIETVINRLIDAYETKGNTPSQGSGGETKIKVFNPSAPPDLTHTKVLSAMVNGSTLGHGQDNWNGVLNAVVHLAWAQASSTDAFKKLMAVNFVDGQKTDEGYRFLADLGISVQGQDANGAWRGVAHIAKKLGLPVTVTFAWREKAGAAFPGVTGSLALNVT